MEQKLCGAFGDLLRRAGPKSERQTTVEKTTETKQTKVKSKSGGRTSIRLYERKTKSGGAQSKKQSTKLAPLRHVVHRLQRAAGIVPDKEPNRVKSRVKRHETFDKQMKI